MRSLSRLAVIFRSIAVVALIAIRPVIAPAQRAAPSDSVASFAASVGGTCLTTTTGAGYCWSEFDVRPGEVFRIIDSTRGPATLQLLRQGWTNRCGLSDAKDVVCDVELSGREWVNVAAPCHARHCLMSLATRGQLPPPPLRSVSTGSSHACALATDGTAYCWGHNQMGQLGNGTRAPDPDASLGQPVPAPVRVPSFKFEQISSGEYLTCGVTVGEQAVYCWGYAQSGETGDSASMRECIGALPDQNRSCSVASPFRVAVESLPGSYGGRTVRFASVSAGQRLACAVSATYEAYCWGNNYRCALGRCRTADSPTAHLINVPGRVVEVGAGYRHACARTAQQRIFCWGNNNGGELGSLATVNAGPDALPPDYRTNSGGNDASYGDICFLGGRCSPVPIEVSSGKRWAALAVGATHTCALAADDGGVYCWGGNSRGLLGIGMKLVDCDTRSPTWGNATCQPTPTRVLGLPELGPPGATPLERELARVPGERIPSAIEGTRLIVNRREARVIFPADTSQSWSTPARTSRGYSPMAYHWRIGIDSGAAPSSISLEIPRSDSTRRFRSLDEMIGTVLPRVCRGDMPCVSLNRATVDRGQVTVTISDSSLIASLFGMRQETFTAERGKHDGHSEYANKLRTEYTDPPIPPPDSATRARAAGERRTFLAANQWIRRDVVSGGKQNDFLLEVGDSLTLTLVQALCFSDMCSRQLAAEDSGWVTANAALVRVREIKPPTGNAPRIYSFPDYREAVVVGLKPGRTTVTVFGIHGDADTIPAKGAAPRAIEKTVIVVPKIERVRFVERPQVVQVVHVGDSVRVSAKAFDASGREMRNIPVALALSGAGEGGNYETRMATVFRSSGTRRIVASFGRHADTLSIVVVDPKTR